MKMRGLARSIFNVAVKVFGSTLMDERTREPVAKAIMICWRGKIYLLGLQGRDQVFPFFLPQKEINFWKREIGFATHPPPDFLGKNQ